MSVERLPAARAGGFTLIELMVTIALVALVAAVAYPSYVDSVRKARRADARSALTEAAQHLERYFTENNQYSSALLCNLGDAGCTAAGQVYADHSENGHYRLRFGDAVRAPTSYLLLAEPLDAQRDDPCGTFTLDQRGVRNVRGGAETDPAKCW